MKKPKLLYVIADGGRARFVGRDENGAFRTEVSFVSKDLHSRARDLGADRPGRVMESATTGRSAMEPRKDPKEAAKENFVTVIADALANERERGAFEELMLVAPAGVLTELRQKLSKPVAELVVSDLQKDLTKVPDHELGFHLSAL